MKLLNLKTGLIVFLIIFLAFILRFYQLGKNPPSLDWDEASLAWNAYSLLQTGTDEFGNAHPVAIRSFNDYKPPVYVYTLMPFQKVLGMNDFSTRLPSAIFGTLTVALVLLLTNSLVSFKTNKKSLTLGLIVSLLFAVTPWVVQFSRVAFEANLALFYFVLGTWLAVLFLKNDKTWWWLLLSLLAFGASVYAYHSSRLTVPVFLLLLALFNFRLLLRHRKLVVVSVVLLGIMIFPLVRNSLRVGGTQARFDTVSVFSQGKVPSTNLLIDKINSSPFVYFPQKIATNYLSHFEFGYLFLFADRNSRHHAPDVGLLLFAEGLGIVFAIIFLARHQPPWLSILLPLLFVSPLASSVALPAPHAIRSLLLVVPLVFLAGLGILSSIKLLGRPKIIALIWAVFLFASTLYYVHQYLIHMPIEYASDWQYGYKQLVAKVLAVENNYDHIIITTKYDQPYIYFLYYGRISPQIKNDGYFYSQMDKYSFADPTNQQYLSSKCCRLLIASAPNEVVPKAKIIDKINFPDGTISFNIWERINTLKK